MTAKPQRQPAWFNFWLVALIAVSLARLASLLLHPAFWAEDGSVYYALAFNHWSPALIATPYRGSLQALPRLAGCVASLFPVQYGPLVMAIAAAAFMLLPLFYILSSRSDSILPTTARKVIAGLAYAIAPYCPEVFGNMANIEWFAAIMMLLIVQCEPAATRRTTAADSVLLTLSSLTGPGAGMVFVACLQPVLLARSDVRRKLILLLAAASVQAWLVFHAPRMQGNLSLAALKDILANHIVPTALLGWNSPLSSLGIWQVLGPIVWIGCLLLAFKEKDVFVAGLFVLSTLILIGGCQIIDHGRHSYFSNGSLTEAGFYAIPVMTLFVSWFSRLGTRPAGFLDILRITAAAVAIVFAISPVFFAKAHECGGAWPDQVSMQYNSAPTGAKVPLAQAPVGWHVWLIRR